MLRFVILVHNHPHLHWDFMLEREAGGALRSWRLEKPPEPGTPIRAEALPDHRRLYLDYEGPVSGNRGEVKRWDAGEAGVVSESPDTIAIELTGQRIRGNVELHRLADDGWTFEYSAANDRPPHSDPLSQEERGQNQSQ
jgi:hypothetical protein